MASSRLPDTTLPPPPGLPREARLASISELVSAQDEVIALARRHIKVFDVDLSWGGWNSAARCDALASYLRRIPGARLDVIVHDTHWIEACGARVAALLARHSHAMTIYRTGERARSAMDPLLIVDDTHFVHRFHVDRVGGKLSIGDPERAKALVERFDEIWESGEPGVTGTVLGL
ncbi:MAG TPA: hypothetical protein VLI21_08435 [Casimicrobiaceae bacterium]|jgi:hypothetical protein|nr:hypothetical protein [Casimicrobiaceae bacterium]